MYDRLFPTGPLLVEPCDRDVAVAAMKHWHYSRSMPSADIDCYGVWEDSRFVGAVVFGIGATAHPGSPYDLEDNEIRELCRVGLDRHTAPVTQIVAEAVRLLRRDIPTLQALVSYADEKEGHLGIIYQAGNWFYLGTSVAPYIRIHGKLWHPRTVVSTFGTQAIPWLRDNLDPDVESVPMPPKHRYVLPLNRRLRRTLERRRQPYPKTIGGVLPVPVCDDDVVTNMREDAPIEDDAAALRWLEEWTPIETAEQGAFF